MPGFLLRRSALKTFANNMLLVVLALALLELSGRLFHPLRDALVEKNEWMTAQVVWLVAFVVQAAVVVIALGHLRCGPNLRELLAIHPKVTLSLALALACIPFAAAAVVVPDAFDAGLFAPLSPFTTSPYFWLGAFLPVFLSALSEELFHRALLQSLLSRLVGNDWGGMVLGALLFTVFHSPQNAVTVLPGGLLLGVVFMRTRSIVCTTVLHLAFNIAASLVTGTQFALTVFIPDRVFVSARPLVGALVLALAVGFEWCWRAAADARARRALPPPNERTGGAAAEPTSA